jgi:hypothetical protein
VANTSTSVTSTVGVSGLAESSNSAASWLANIFGVEGHAISHHADQVIYGGHFQGEGTGIIHHGVGGTASEASLRNVGVDGGASGSGTNNWGVRGLSIGTGDAEIGVRGEATGSATSGYGVWGAAGTDDCDSDPGDCPRAAIFANGISYAVTTFESSDAQFKQNINGISNASSILSQLQPKTYTFNKVGFPSMNFPGGLHYGFVAQDVESVMPTIVRTFINPTVYDSMGNVINSEVTFKALNYSAIIPVLTAALQEQQERIDSLITALNGSPRNTDILNQENRNGLQIELKDISTIILNQNDPNPFNESTRITFTIPQEITSAKMLFTNTAGSIINTINIEERGVSELQVFASDLSSGIYTYTLICDGKVIDSKKMVKQ